jgi:septum formation protein
VDTAQINFKPSIADANLIEELLKDEAPVLDCAGGLMVEHPLVREHLESIDGTEDSVMGLSKDLVIQLLTEMKQKLSGNK